MYALEQDYPDLTFIGNSLMVILNQDEVDKVSELLYQRGIQVTTIVKETEEAEAQHEKNSKTHTK